MSTIGLAVTIAGCVAGAAVIAAFVIVLIGTRRGYKFSHTLAWTPPSKNTLAGNAATRPAGGAAGEMPASPADPLRRAS